MGQRVSVLGLPIDPLTEREVVDRLGNAIAAKLPIQVVTVNPEFAVRAAHDASFRRVLESAEIAVADGVGLRAAATSLGWALPHWQPARFVVAFLQSIWAGILILGRGSDLRNPIPETVTGSDLIWTLVKLGEQSGWRFYLVGGEHGAAQRATAAFKRQFPDLKILGADEGLTRDEFNDTQRRAHLAERIGQLRPDVLLVAFGAPKQDLFIAEQRTRLNASVMIGVGGAFDFIAGSTRRAPQWLRALGLEWLWRFLHQPWRARRIWNAVVVFPLLILRSRQRV